MQAEEGRGSKREFQVLYVKILLHPNYITILPILYPHIIFLSPWNIFLDSLSYGILLILLKLLRTL